MARSIILGNSGLTVGLNEKGLVHDFYFPYVGLENLTSARLEPHHIGVWVDGNFSWISDHVWHATIDFEDTALVSNSVLENSSVGIRIHFKDFVDPHNDIFARKLYIENLDDAEKDVRIFFHQVFQISSLGRSDTAMFVPGGNYMLDYKGRCSILAYAEDEDGKPFDQYAAGNAGIEGKQGTFMDAVDGELSMSAVEHAGVDSTIRVQISLQPKSTKVVRYWLAVADSQLQLESLQKKMLNGGFDARLHATYQHWRDWLSIAVEKTQNIKPELKTAMQKSLMTIKAHTDSHGGIIASCDSSIYNYGRDYYSYVWPRDGAFVMWPLIKLGYVHEPRAFFEFCKNIIHPDGYMMHKYQPDKAIGSTWHPLIHGKRQELAIQEDETAIVVFMLSEYYNYSNDTDFVLKMYDSLLKPACDFMAQFFDLESNLPHASYDLWEEKFLSNTYTAAVTMRALARGAEIAVKLDNYQDAERWSAASERINVHSNTYFNEDKGYFNKGFLLTDDKTVVDETLDVSSVYAVWMFGMGTKQQMARTMAKIQSELLDISPSGGAARYENDNYFKSEPAYKGNPWFVTTLWLAQIYASIGKNEEAIKYIEWSLSHAMPSGLLSEQVEPENGSIVGVTPLVWSHAELINTILDTNK